ncbi:MAG: hypothetical protein U0871_24835 [Gemmataceae bacterium]
MNRGEFQALAEVRVREAEALLAAGLWDGAYYLAGYAVECGLKACIAKRTKTDDFPDKKFATDCHTHNLVELLRLAGLKDVLDVAAVPGSKLSVNWTLVRSWSEAARYRRWSQNEAAAYLDAVTDPVDGVLPWIISRW